MGAGVSALRGKTMSKKAETNEVSDAVWLAECMAEGLFLEDTGPEKSNGAVTHEQMRDRQIGFWRDEGEAACLPVLLRALDVYATAFGYNDVGEVLRWLDKKVGKLGGDGGAPLDPFTPVGPR
jgi:hypothetical protein